METCLSLDEDLAPFRARVEAVEALRASGRKDLPDLRWVLARGAGRLLRSPTVFEDAVKTLCTTNCTWAVTRGLVSRLCERLGEPAPLDSVTFPTAAAMAARDERFYREEIRAGYRAPFLLALARAAASGSVDLEAFRRAGTSAAEETARSHPRPGRVRALRHRAPPAPGGRARPPGAGLVEPGQGGAAPRQAAAAQRPDLPALVHPVRRVGRPGHVARGDRGLAWP